MNSVECLAERWRPIMASGVWWRLELERMSQGPGPQLPLLSRVRVVVMVVVTVTRGDHMRGPFMNPVTTRGQATSSPDNALQESDS